MSQTSVSEQVAALNGMKYALLKAENVLSYAAEGRVYFGRFLAVGTDKDLQGKVPSAAGDITSIKLGRGVVLQSHANENVADGLDAGIEDKKPASVMSKGGVYVEVEDDVTVDSDVYVRFDDTAGGTGGTTKKGIFRSDADTATAALLPNARWIKSSELMDGKKIAVLELM